MNEPFSHPIRIEAIPRDGMETRFEANQAERAALAAFNGLPAVGKLIAVFTLKHGGRGAVIVHGELSAEITQTCVVTLEPFDTAIGEVINLRFARAIETPKPRGVSIDESEMMGLSEEDRPDTIVDGKIDLGAIISEFLTLSLDPYPRKPGVAFDAPKEDDNASSNSPFSALKKS
jgi:uncharacterized metal-binding protein YceD (DUF177 family)